MQKIGRLDFSLRDHVFAKMWGFFQFFFFYICIWSVSLLISCLISFIFFVHYSFFALYWLKSLSLDCKVKLKSPCFFLRVTLFLHRTLEILIFVPVNNQDLDFQCPMSWSFFMLNGLRLEVIFAFVDIGRIVDQYCLKLSFHIR